MKQVTISKEEKQQKRNEERSVKKALRLAMKEQTKLGRATAKSLGLYAFDQNGLFQMTDGRWICFYRIKAKVKLSDAELIGLFKGLSAATEIFTCYIEGVKDNKYSCITVTVKADNIIQAGKLQRKASTELSEKLILEQIEPYEVLSLITGKDAETIKKEITLRKDIWKDRADTIILYNSYLDDAKRNVSTYRTLQFPTGDAAHLIEEIANAAKEVTVSMRIVPVTSLEELDFLRILEKKYNRHLDNQTGNGVNISFSVCGSYEIADAKDLVERKIRNVFLSAEGLASFAFGSQLKVYESMKSFGLIEGHNQIRALLTPSGEVLKSLLEDKADAS